MQKAIIYCRVSSERQKTEGHGLDSQEQRCRDYARQKGYEVEIVFHDSYSGGGDFFNRPAMSKLIEYLDSHRYTSYVVIFDDLKRFARDITFHWKLRQEFRSRNAIPECLNFQFEDTPEGRFIETIIASHGQLEREQNRRQVVQKMEARLQLGYWTFSDVPPGYKYIKDPEHGKLAVIDEGKGKIIREALEGYACGRFPEQENVRRFLADKDINKGKPVYLDYVKRMLVRVFYAGYIEYLPWKVSRRLGKHEGLIDISTYEKIQARLNGKSTTHVKNYLNEDFPLRSFVLCSECNQPYTASWSKGRSSKFPYYRCKTNGCSERNKSTRKVLLETQFEDILRGINPTEGVLKLTKAIIVDLWSKKMATVNEQQGKVAKELGKIDTERARFIDLVGRATDERVVAAYEEKIGSLSEKENTLKGSLSEYEKHRPNIETAADIVIDFLKNPLEQWQKGNIYTKKLVLQLVFERNLAYNRKSGFETAFLSLPLRVFTLPVAQKSSVVLSVGIEPTS